jgi:hypothetical protein
MKSCFFAYVFLLREDKICFIQLEEEIKDIDYFLHQKKGLKTIEIKSHLFHPKCEFFYP